MKDTIYREAAIELCDWYEHEFSECEYAIRALADDLKSLPAAAPEAHFIKLRTDIDMNEFLKAFEAAKKNPPTIIPRETTGWIPVTERLPEPRVDVWTCSDIGQIQGYYEENVGIWYASFGQGRDYLELYVTAWMPLPPSYQGD